MINRILWIDLIKAFSIFSVVLLHASSPLLTQIGNTDIIYWWISNIYSSMVRMAVPLFFMVSGALLLRGKSETLTVFFHKRFFKIIVPLIAWTIIYIFLKKYVLHKDINIITNLMDSLVRPEMVHLWFLYTLIGLYLFVPILKIFIQYSSQKLQIYYVILWIITVSLFPTVNKLFGLEIKNHLPMLSGYIGFFVVGYMLYNLKISKFYIYIALLFIFISTIATAIGTFYLSNQMNQLDQYFYGSMSITTLIQSISFYILLKYIGERLNKKTITAVIITKLSITSFGIYLIHPIYLRILSSNKFEIGLGAIHGNPLYMIPVQTIVAFLLSFITIYLIQKIPLIRQIAP